MNRTELVAAMAEKAGVSKKDADNILKAFNVWRNIFEIIC